MTFPLQTGGVGFSSQHPLIRRPDEQKSLYNNCCLLERLSLDKDQVLNTECENFSGLLELRFGSSVEGQAFLRSLKRSHFSWLLFGNRSRTCIMSVCLCGERKKRKKEKSESTHSNRSVFDVCERVNARVKIITRAGNTLGSFIRANKPVLPNRLWSLKVRPVNRSQVGWMGTWLELN